MGQIGLDELFEMLTSIFTPQAKDADKGELVIVGSGIAPLRQMTLETIQYIRAADIVYHAAQTAAEEAFIGMNAKASFDLRCLYGPTKHRTDTYVQMAEVCWSHTETKAMEAQRSLSHSSWCATFVLESWLLDSCTDTQVSSPPPGIGPLLLLEKKVITPRCSPVFPRRIT